MINFRLPDSDQCFDCSLHTKISSLHLQELLKQGSNKSEQGIEGFEMRSASKSKNVSPMGFAREQAH